MPYKFDIRFSEPRRRFEEELYVEGSKGRKLATGIMDTGASITLIDLEFALSLGATIKKTESVVGVSMIPTFIYMVDLKISVVNQTPGKEPLVYEKVRELGALPYMNKGGSVSQVFAKGKDTVSRAPIPTLLFKVGFPGVSVREITNILSNLVCEKNNVVIEAHNLTSLGAPLLVGVDILKDLAHAGFSVDFDF
ncbi:MAG: hypothetical protein ACFFG0_10670 [Candidatus Thorarchaeota archaeon]